MTKSDSESGYRSLLRGLAKQLSAVTARHIELGHTEGIDCECFEIFNNAGGECGGDAEMKLRNGEFLYDGKRDE